MSCPCTPSSALARRNFLAHAGFGLSGAALAILFGESAQAGRDAPTALGFSRGPQFAPKAKRVIYLFQSGGPSQMDLFDYKPKLEPQRGSNLPESIRMGQRLTTMTSGQDRLPVVPSKYSFTQHGENGTWVSQLLPQHCQIDAHRGH
jgi:hypothetical protein